ncbi:NAD(P)/FAD-dependent oxidoreductase [Sphingobium sp. CAP-1]|uniref:NAD(P)-binding protein n=1 Tax=Sphingobium sp. CAP-1 TaxID=2676077 RepID=UPI0012BB4467|nr:NAD(P)/FAD-dependent oxidoreductase [Sphingobium sp. CAP-1]QGP80377.1 NAD(P)-binding protein [Sphingobium sp. CAP-1]
MKADRRAVLKGGMAAASALALPACDTLPPGSSGGADMVLGHRLRDRAFPDPVREEKVPLLIVGGGVAGLSAGWRLREAGFDDFRLIELERQPGGNARGGRNAVSAYPLGAHYLPIPNQEARGLRHMLRQLGMIVGDRDGKPVYDPLQLCADLQERLLWQGKWQEGLRPRTGLTAKDKADLSAFDQRMAAYARRRDAQGRPAFAIPIAYSAQDADLLALDRIAFTSWLDQQGLTSPVLRAHVRYACRDDYGCEPRDVSAWAGIHYFASRRGFTADGTGDNDLTWPEGNGRLTRLMADRLGDRLATGRIAFRARREDGKAVVDLFDVRRDESIRYRADAVILAMPHFIASRLLGEKPDPAYGYAPWLIANVTVDRAPGGRGSALAWDNVSASSASLGYVVATHQSASREGPTVLTWYMALSDMPPASARRLLVERADADWRRLVRDDLLTMNPDLDGAIRSIDLWKWGHAMIRPTPDFLWRVAPRQRAAIHPPFFRAHSDMSGLSLFEEAHYRGMAAAESALTTLGHGFETLL